LGLCFNSCRQKLDFCSKHSMHLPQTLKIIKTLMEDSDLYTKEEIAMVDRQIQLCQEAGVDLDAEAQRIAARAEVMQRFIDDFSLDQLYPHLFDALKAQDVELIKQHEQNVAREQARLANVDLRVPPVIVPDLRSADG
jgi:hypothetical protein